MALSDKQVGTLIIDGIVCAGGGTSNPTELTKAEYLELTETEQNTGEYLITDYFEEPEELENAAIQNTADVYSSEKTYNIGDRCIYGNVLYRCATAITVAEQFDSSKWTATTVAAEIQAVEDELNAELDALNGKLAPVNHSSQMSSDLFALNNLNLITIGKIALLYGSIVAKNVISTGAISNPIYIPAELRPAVGSSQQYVPQINTQNTILLNILNATATNSSHMHIYGTTALTKDGSMSVGLTWVIE